MIHSFEYCIKKTKDVGIVTESKECWVKVAGIKNSTIGEGITFETEQHGRVMAIDSDGVEVLVFSRIPIKPKTRACATGSPLSISAGDGLLGHVINTVGHSITTRRQKSHLPEKYNIEVTPSGISSRSRISRFFETGVVLCDLIVPLGMGQRELVIGDRQSGKTHFLLQVMLTQARLGKVCIYCAVGKRTTEIKKIEEFLETHNIMKQSIIVAADSYSSPGEIIYAPNTAMSLAEFFRDQGKDVLLILDDLTTHAKYYREVALLSGRFPGRESYPGDIFHIHSKLLERAGSFMINKKQVSITCLPVAESIGGDITGYIQTNLMSMTDGHLYFDSDLYFLGRRPAINIYLSVTRVGKQTQSHLFQDIGFQLLRFLKTYEDLQRLLRFEMELSASIQETLSKGAKLINFFNQIGHSSIPVNLQAYIVALIWKNKFEGKNTEQMASEYNKKSSLTKKVDGICAKAKTLDEMMG